MMKTAVQTRARTRLTIVVVVPLLLAGVRQKRASKAQRESATSLPAVIWRDPGDVSKLNLFYGAGGESDAPDPNGHFVFIKEDLEGTSPKFDVRDDRGRTWKVKLGPEARPETAATRLVWAAGYFVDEDYFVPELKVENLPKLRRGRKFVSRDGMVDGARLELRRKDIRKLGNWDWYYNDFTGTRELNGLRTMMCLINNWDLKAVNNSVYEIGRERRYVVTDLGASFGKTGNYLKRSKGVPRDYLRSPFIVRLEPGHVDFVMHSRPFFPMKLHARAYAERARMESIAKDIPVADARWIGRILAGLTPGQLRDCFRAAGYDDEATAVYVRKVQERIQALTQLQASGGKSVRRDPNSQKTEIPVPKT